MSTLSDCVNIWYYKTILIVSLTYKECSLIVRPWTKAKRFRQHTTLITPRWISTYKCTTINTKFITRLIKQYCNIILNSSLDLVF